MGRDASRAPTFGQPRPRSGSLPAPELPRKRLELPGKRPEPLEKRLGPVVSGGPASGEEEQPAVSSQQSQSGRNHPQECHPSVVATLAVPPIFGDLERRDTPRSQAARPSERPRSKKIPKPSLQARHPPCGSGSSFPAACLGPTRRFSGRSGRGELREVGRRERGSGSGRSRSGGRGRRAGRRGRGGCRGLRGTRAGWRAARDARGSCD